MDWAAFAHGFGMLIGVVSAVFPLAALFMRNDETSEDE